MLKIYLGKRSLTSPMDQNNIVRMISFWKRGAGVHSFCRCLYMFRKDPESTSQVDSATPFPQYDIIAPAFVSKRLLFVSKRLFICIEMTSICIETTCIETTLYRNDRTPTTVTTIINWQSIQVPWFSRKVPTAVHESCKRNHSSPARLILHSSESKWLFSTRLNNQKNISRQSSSSRAETRS